MVSAANTTQFIHLPSQVDDIKDVHTAASRTATVIRGINDFAESVGQVLPKPISNSIKGMRLLLVFDIIFEVPTLINRVYGAVRATTVVDRITNSAQAVLSTFALTGYSALILSTLRIVGVVAKDAITWTSHFVKALFAVSAIRLAISSYECVKDVRVLVQIKRELRERKYTDLTACSNYVLENSVRITKALKLPTTSKVDETARAILSEISKGDAQAALHRDELVQSLNRRINTVIGLEVTKIAVRAGGLAIFGLMLFTPTGPVVYAVSAVQSVASLTMFGVDQYVKRRSE